jgi:protein-S-isoprenylcysteine O-methyltransferase Ste14
MNWLARVIINSAQKEYSRATKSFFTAWGFFLFEIIVPAVLLALSLAADRFLATDRLFDLGSEIPLTIRLAVFLPLFGLAQTFIVWTAAHQLRHSGGTPAFRAPPKRLLVSGPFRLCRNPMVFGYLLDYYALAFLVASPVALLGICPVFNLFALYVIIEVEEVELEERFGAGYLAYKASVNRMIPMPSKWYEWLRSPETDPPSPVDSLDEKGQRA